MTVDKRIPAAAIRRAWLDPGLTRAEGARLVGLTRVNFWLRARALGLPQRKGGRPKVLPEALFARMWLAGVRAADIAAHYGTGAVTPWQTARRMGLPSRARGERRIGLAEFLAAEAEAALARRMARTAEAEARARRIVERRVA